MIKQFFKFSTLSLIVLLAVSSCSDSDDSIPLLKGDFENGYFISNEGNFGKPNAAVTFIANDLTQVTQDVFSGVNSTTLGDVLQSIAFDDDYAFLVVNNSNKIEVVNRYTFQSVATITEKISKPRYALVENGKLYVTNSATKSVEVYDAKTFAHLTTIAIETTVEEIKEDNGFIYVMNAGYGTGKNITVIDINSNTVVKTLTVGDGLNSIEIEDGILYALHKTGITKVTTSNNEIIGEIPFEEGLKNANKLEVADNFIYFFAGSKIFNVVDGKIFYTDVKGFKQNSEVLVYDLNGKFLKSFTGGMGANGVYSND